MRVSVQRHAPVMQLWEWPGTHCIRGWVVRSVPVRKISPPPGFDLWTVQPVASRYTDSAIPAHRVSKVFYVKLWNIRVKIKLEIINWEVRVIYEGWPVAYRGGVWGVQTPPRNSEGPPNLYQTQPDLWKLLKIAEFRTPTPQGVRKKKGSKILKLPRFAIVLH